MKSRKSFHSPAGDATGTTTVLNALALSPYKDSLDQQKFHSSPGILGQIYRLVREIPNQEFRISKFAEFIC